MRVVFFRGFRAFRAPLGVMCGRLLRDKLRLSPRRAGICPPICHRLLCRWRVDGFALRLLRRLPPAPDLIRGIRGNPPFRPRPASPCEAGASSPPFSREGIPPMRFAHAEALSVATSNLTAQPQTAVPRSAMVLSRPRGPSSRRSRRSRRRSSLRRRRAGSVAPAFSSGSGSRVRSFPCR